MQIFTTLWQRQSTELILGILLLRTNNVTLLIELFLASASKIKLGCP